MISLKNRHLMHLIKSTNFTSQIIFHGFNSIPTKSFSINLENDNLDEQKKTGAFDNFDIKQQTKSQLERIGISYLFPIQSQTFKLIFSGADLIGKDRTGSGKTLAFALPILEKLRSDNKLVNHPGQKPLIMILAPTRELCTQLTNEFLKLKNHKHEFRVTSIYGGVPSIFQTSSLEKGSEIVIGTPGRMIDLLNQKRLNLDQVEHVILDETDQMLNIGFKTDIEEIFSFLLNHIKTQNKEMNDVQFLLFSATIPIFVKSLAEKFMKPNLTFIDMVRNTGTKTSKTVKHFCLKVDSRAEKIDKIIELVLNYAKTNKNVLVFTETKKDADETFARISKKINAGLLHGDVPQSNRERTLQNYRKGIIKCLVATNVASRGLDIPEIDLVIQISPPHIVEDYIHRSGRTGRAGKEGKCISLYLEEDYKNMSAIEKIADIRFLEFRGSEEEKTIIENAEQAAMEPDRFEDQFNQKIAFSFDFPVTAQIKTIQNDNLKRKGENGEMSLLTNVKGYTTFMMDCEQFSDDINFFKKILDDYFFESNDDNFFDGFEKCSLLSSKKGICFDVKSSKVDHFLNTLSNIEKESTFQIEKLVNLPKLEEFSISEKNYRFEPTSTFFKNKSTSFPPSFNKKALVILNLPQNLEMNDVQKLLAQNDIKTTKSLIPNKIYDLGNKVCFLWFENELDAENAKGKLEVIEIEDRLLHVKFKREFKDNKSEDNN